MQIFQYQFKPKLIPTLATILLLPVLVSLGQWQSHKAELKLAKQTLFEQRGADLTVSIGAEKVDLETIRYRPVSISGKYEPEFQILIDNQISQGRAGYHVITPLHLTGTNMRVLVNRGWVPVGSDRNVLPNIETPKDEVTVIGYAHDPVGRYLELSAPPEIKAGEWISVWQNLDMKRYTKAVKFDIQPVIVLLDPVSPAGGFVREWPKPDFKIDMNRGYAMQWYFMSIALVIIYLVTNLKKVIPQGDVNAK